MPSNSAYTSEFKKHQKRIQKLEADLAFGKAEVLPEEIEERRKQQTAAQRAQEELARRELARRFLLPFIHRFMPSYDAGWFHKDLCMHLEKFSDDVAERRSPRLLITVPPRHGKSLTTSQYFPAWHLGRHPDHEFITTSYAESLQTDFSKKIQQIIKDPEYKILFPGVQIPKNHEAVARWQLAQLVNNQTKLTGGGLLATGVGGPITGRGANIALIDDPIKNMEEADSAVVREAVWKWYTSTLYTRLAPGGGVLLIQTRWHDGDLAGRVLAEFEKALAIEKKTGEFPAEYDRWTVVNYPAIATENEEHRRKGKALHPARYDEIALKRIQRTLSKREWSALYQQNPVPDSGDYFTTEMIRYYENEHPPLSQLDIYATGDLAISKEDKAAYTVFLIAGLDKDDNLWLLDLRRDRWDTAELIDQILDIHKTWKPLAFGLEKDKVEMAIAPLLNKIIVDEKLFDLHIQELKVGGRDKQVRARPIQGRMKQGKVLIPKYASWSEQFVTEHLRFPAGLYIDCVDAHAWMGQMIGAVDFTKKPKAGKPKKKESWRDRLKNMTSDTVKTYMGA
jgi:predicted phage terminase large subunit-like protein